MGDGPLLAARPVEGATHYQLHTGLYRDAFAAERESFPSALRRALFRPALALNARRREILRVEDRLLRERRAALMVFSASLRERLTGRIGFPAERVTLDRPGVDTRVFRAAADEPGPAAITLRLIFVGHNFELKGLRTLLRAVAIVRREVDASIAVVGRGAIARFRLLAARLGIGDRVRFTGRLDAAAVAAAYRTSDALVHPTFYDPYPLVAVEALASGIPVVTTRRCGAAEILPPGAGLLLDDPRDARALAEALSRLADRDVRARMRAAARMAAPISAREHFERVRRWLGLASDS